MSGNELSLLVDGVRLEALRYPAREPGLPTLVFLHEGLGCVSLWRDFPQRLCAATGCGGLLYSRRGYGGSDPCDLPRPLDYMACEAIEVLPRVLDEAGVGPHLLIGHSDGGSIALIYAGSEYRGDLRALVTLAPHVICEQLSVDSIARAQEAFEEGELRARLQKYHGDNVDCAFRGWNRAWLDPAFRDWDITSYLPGISVPQLVIQGLDDEYGSIMQPGLIKKHSSGPVELQLLPQCGHSPCRDQPEQSLALMAGFIDSHAR